MSHRGPSPWDDDEALLRALPRGPGQRGAPPPTDAAFGALRFSDDFLAAASAPLKTKAAGGGRAGPKKGDKGGSEQPGALVYRCAVCHVDSSGPASFAQHCGGRAHAKKAGAAGFAGLEAVGGRTPPVDAALLRLVNGGGSGGDDDGGGGGGGRGGRGDGGGKPPKGASGGKGRDKSGGGISGGKAQPGEPAVVRVAVSDESHAHMRSALQRSASEAALGGLEGRGVAPPQQQQPLASPAQGAARPLPAPRGGGGVHKSASSPVLGRALPVPRGGTVPHPQPPPPPPPPPPPVSQPKVEIFRNARVEARGGGGGGGGGGREGVGGGGAPRHAEAAVPPAPPTPPPGHEARPDVAEMARQRAALPAASFATAICETVARHPVTIVMGETGTALSRHPFTFTCPSSFSLHIFQHVLTSPPPFPPRVWQVHAGAPVSFGRGDLLPFPRQHHRDAAAAHRGGGGCGARGCRALRAHRRNRRLHHPPRKRLLVRHPAAVRHHGHSSAPA